MTNIDDRIVQLLSAQTVALGRIANALEAIALTNAPAPNFVKPIEQYASFDFTSIGARVNAKDANGPSEIEWGGYSWTRRSPQNKFGEAIWFSRPLGKDADGNVKYARLITFRKISEAEPLPRKVEALAHAEPSQSSGGTEPKISEPEQPVYSELDDYLGPRTEEPKPEQTWPKNEAEFVEWLKAHSINGKETYTSLGTDSKSWMRINAGKTWADVAKTIAATLGNSVRAGRAPAQHSGDQSC